MAIRAAHRLLGEYIEKEQETIGTDFRTAVKNLMNLHKIKNKFTEEDYDFHAKELLELVEQKSVEWSEDFEENIRTLLHNKLTWHSEDGSMSSTVLIDDKTLKDIVSGIWFYVGKEALKYPNNEIHVQEWNEEDEKQIRQIERIVKEAGCTPQLQEQIHNFLKSLRPQSKEELAKMLQDEYNKGKEIGEREGYTKGFNDAAFGGELKEWSKEDVKSFNNVLSGLKYTYEDLVNHKSFDSAEDVKNAFDWLNSFRIVPIKKKNEDAAKLLKEKEYVDP